MNKWTQHLRLADVFHNDDLTFEQRRDAIVDRIRRANWYDPDNYTLPDLIEELEGTTDTDEFDQVWDAFYDYADIHRIWVETI